MIVLMICVHQWWHGHSVTRQDYLAPEYRSASPRLGNEFQMAGDPRLRKICVLRVVGAIVHDNILEIEGTQTRQASNIDPVLIRIGSPLVMGVDAAF